VFPDLFRDMRIQRLAGFFSTLRDSLAHWGRQIAANNADAPGHLALRASEQPLIVLLTPGPYNETYHEQAFLARYLGFPLVEGSDLTVRNGMVWLKTLSGLQRVHVVMRRVDDDYCDPLELRAGLDRSGAARQRLGDQFARLEFAGIRRLAGILARHLRTPAGRTVEDAVGRHLVVRRAGGIERSDRKTR